MGFNHCLFFRYVAPKQNARSLLIPVSDTIFYALSMIAYILSSILASIMIEKATMECKIETAMLKSITVSDTDVKSDVAFCLGPPFEKTKSGTFLSGTCRPLKRTVNNQ